jgi:hypothetical protein
MVGFLRNQFVVLLRFDHVRESLVAFLRACRCAFSSNEEVPKESRKGVPRVFLRIRGKRREGVALADRETGVASEALVNF